MTRKYYKLIEFPIKGPFKEMTESEARESFIWFIHIIPERIEILKTFLKETGYNPRKLDFSPKSLDYLGEWLAKHVTTRKLTREETEKIENGLSEHLKPHIEIPKEDLSEETLSLCYDIGMYFGEVFRKHIKGVEWDFVRKPKNDLFYHQPVLVGGKIPLNPVWIVQTAAIGFVGKTSSSSRLREVYEYWIHHDFKNRG